MKGTIWCGKFTRRLLSWTERHLFLVYLVASVHSDPRYAVHILFYFYLFIFCYPGHCWTVHLIIEWFSFFLVDQTHSYFLFIWIITCFRKKKIWCEPHHNSQKKIYQKEDKNCTVISTDLWVPSCNQHLFTQHSHIVAIINKHLLSIHYSSLFFLSLPLSTRTSDEEQIHKPGRHFTK